MIHKTELITIRNRFSIQHMYKNYEPEAHQRMEIGHYDGVCFMLMAIVTDACPEQPGPKLDWLITVIFSRTTLFLTGKDIHVHVMVALDTLIEVAVQ